MNRFEIPLEINIFTCNFEVIVPIKNLLASLARVDSFLEPEPRADNTDSDYEILFRKTCHSCCLTHIYKFMW